MAQENQIVHFRGRVITVTTDDVLLPNGHRAQLEVVHHPGGAAVVALDARRQVCLLRQYRYVAGGWIWELPAGKLEPNEPPIETAKRELIEEGGRSAGQWQSLGTILSSPGVFSEVIHLFQATQLEASQAAHEHSEVIEIHWIPFAQAHEWTMNGTITDAKTVIGIARAFALDTPHKSPAADVP